MTPTVKLSDLNAALDADSEAFSPWLDRNSGEVVIVESEIIVRRLIEQGTRKAADCPPAYTIKVEPEASRSTNAVEASTALPSVPTAGQAQPSLGNPSRGIQTTRSAGVFDGARIPTT